MNDSQIELGHDNHNKPSHHMPRRFVFDVVETKSNPKPSGSAGSKTFKKSLEAEQHMPFIFSFPEPTNHKESYSLLVKNILGIYNHVRLLIVEEYYDELKHAIQGIKIEKPSDCLAIVKHMINNCVEKMSRFSEENKEIESDPMKSYEELLQKAEAKIRIFIRNEQIFRLNFDIFTQKIEDSEKVLLEAQQEIEIRKKAQESLIKENFDLKNKLHQKDTELKRVQKELEELERKYRESTMAGSMSSNGVENIDQMHNMNDPRKVKNPQEWNNQLLGILLKDSKQTPTKISGRTSSNFEGKTSWNETKQNSSRGTLAEKIQEQKKVNITGHNILNISSENLRKTDRMKTSLLAEFKRIIDSNRGALNASLDVVLNKSNEHSPEKSIVSGATLSPQKINQDKIKSSHPEEQIRVRPPTKERASQKSGGGEKSLSLFTTSKNTIQKIINISERYASNQDRPLSTEKSRGSPMTSKRTVKFITENSPDMKSSEAKGFHNYSSSQSDFFSNPSYNVVSSRKTPEKRGDRSKSKGNSQTSQLVKTLIAEQLSKKFNGTNTYK